MHPESFAGLYCIVSLLVVSKAGERDVLGGGAKNCWAVPGVRGGTALRDFGVCLGALLSVPVPPSRPVPNT